jgi:hypothetical protein
MNLLNNNASGKLVHIPINLQPSIKYSTINKDRQQ